MTAMQMCGLSVMLLTLILDWRLGEPAARWHPVVWMGRYLAWAGAWSAPVAASTCANSARGTRTLRLEEHSTTSYNVMTFCKGFVAWGLGAVVVLGLGVAVQAAVLWCLHEWAWPVMALLLKPMFAWRMLHDEVLAVEQALRMSVQHGRDRLTRLVSREVSALDESLVREGAIETLAENLNDSVVAPLFFFAIGGLPLAALYRYANTADAMWGYKGERAGRQWLWAGKWAARADDVLSWLPARMTAGALMLGARLATWRQLPSIAACTPSPNGGWPMGAIALRLGLGLRKPGAYSLNPSGRAAQKGDVQAALRLCRRALCLALPVCGFVLLKLNTWGLSLESH